VANSRVIRQNTPIRRQLDEHGDQAHEHLVDVFEEAHQPRARLAGTAHGDAEQQREDDDLQHVALGHGGHRVGGEDVDERVLDAGGLAGIERDVHGGRAGAAPGHDQQRQQQRDGDGDGGGEQIQADGLAADPAHAAGIAETGGAADQRHQHQRHHHELQAGDEDAAAGVDEAIDTTV
jgi:hypothetical protein